MICRMLMVGVVLVLATWTDPPQGLKTEMLENPMGLERATPRFSWIVENSTPGAKQTAYQVQAASSPEKLDSPDLWVSGKVDSDQSHLVEYGGKPLASRQKAWWRVKTWEQDGRESDWSEPAWFEMALLEQSDWSARWIAAELHMGTWTHVANRLSDGKQTEPTNQTELNLCQK